MHTLGHDETWGDTIHTGEISPLYSQALGQPDSRSFRSIVCHLRLGNVDQNGAHGGSYNEISLALALEDFACGLRSPHHTIIVDAIIPCPTLLIIF